MYKRILLPVSNPRNAAYTLKAALQLLDPDGTIVLLSVVGTSEDYPDRAESYRKKTNLVIKLMKSVAPDKAEVVPEIILSPSIRDTILDQIATHNIDLAILGYSLQSTLYKIRYGDVIYPLVKDAPCDVILSNLKYESTFERILIPSAGYKHSIHAVKVARAIAEQITVFSKDYDLIIMGASERSRGASAIFGTVVDKVIEQTDRNIFVVRA